MKSKLQFWNIFLKTERLNLRPIEAKDFEMVFLLRSDEAVNRYIIRDLMTEEREAHEFIRSIQSDMRSNLVIYWMLESTRIKQTIGSICLWNFSEDQRVAELGYTLHSTFQQQGYMQEAIRTVLRFGFEDLNLVQVEAFTHRANERSLGLLGKNNFIKMPERKDPGFDHNVVYVLTKKEWTKTL